MERERDSFSGALGGTKRTHQELQITNYKSTLQILK